MLEGERGSLLGDIPWQRFHSLAEAAVVLDPVVTVVMSLFAPSAVTDDRILHTVRTLPNDLFRTGHGPVKGWVAMIDRKWDNENRNCLEALSL